MRKRKWKVGQRVYVYNPKGSHHDGLGPYKGTIMKVGATLPCGSWLTVAIGIGEMVVHSRQCRLLVRSHKRMPVNRKPIGKAHDCTPKGPHLWAPGGLHGTHEHDEATEWAIFKLDPSGGPGSGDLIPAIDGKWGDGPFSWWQAKAICEAHNREVAAAVRAARKGRTVIGIDLGLEGDATAIVQGRQDENGVVTIENVEVKKA